MPKAKAVKKTGEKTDVELIPGVIVWAKMQRYPHWPAVIADLADAPQAALDYLEEMGDSHVLVLFFASGSYTPVLNDKAYLTPFRCEEFDRFAANRTIKKALEAALVAEEAKDNEAALMLAQGLPTGSVRQKAKSTSTKSSKSSKKSKSKKRSKAKDSDVEDSPSSSSSSDDEAMHDDDSDIDFEDDSGKKAKKKKSKKKAKPQTKRGEKRARSSSSNAKVTEAKRQRSTASAAQAAKRREEAQIRAARLAEKQRRKEERQRIRIARAIEPVVPEAIATKEILDSLQLGLVHGIKTVSTGEGSREIIETLSKLRHYNVSFELIGATEVGKLVRRLAQQPPIDNIYGDAIVTASKELYQRYLKVAHDHLSVKLLSDTKSSSSSLSSSSSSLTSSSSPLSSQGATTEQSKGITSANDDDDDDVKPGDVVAPNDNGTSAPVTNDQVNQEEEE